MFNVRNGVIYHTRGDTASFVVNLKDADGNAITGYTAMMTVKKRLKDDDFLFQVPVKNGMVNISHETTQSLPYGDYVYDIEVHMADGEVQTIGPYEYHLTPDVTT